MGGRLTFPSAAFIVRRTGCPLHLSVLGVLLAAIIVLFIHDVIDMVTIWWTSSTFNHCLFVPFLIGWLVQQRAPQLRMLTPVAWRPGLLWLAAGNLCWLIGDAGGVGLLRHAGLIVMLQGAVATMLGPVLVRALLFPIFYAFFMIPFGAEIVPPLQIVTAKIAMGLLQFSGVTAHIEGIFITIPNGYFEVAEACSGAKFVIAMAAYGVLVCNVCFRSWGRRVIFLGSALGLSILANGVRAYATIYVAHVSSVDAAVGFDHVVYGWLFFAIVMTIMMLCAWPFFDRAPGESVFDPRVMQGAMRQKMSVSHVTGLAIALMLAGPVWSMISAARAQPLPTGFALPDVRGWHRDMSAPTYPWKPRFDGADGYLQGRYSDGAGYVVDLVLVRYARQVEGRELVGFGQGAADPDSEWVWSSPAPAPAHGRGEQITAPGPVVRHVVSFYRVGQNPLTGSATQVKLATMKARIAAGDQRAVAVLVSAEERAGRDPDRAIAAFLQNIGKVEEVADAATMIR